MLQDRYPRGMDKEQGFSIRIKKHLHYLYSQNEMQRSNQE